MAEFDPMPPNDATEAAYREALLGDDAGREQRRARLMAALPRPQAPAAVPVSRDALAWRWQPYAWGLLAMGLVLAATLVMRRPSTDSRPPVDPRLAAAGQAASAPVVVAQAEPAREAAPPAVAVALPPQAAAKARPLKPRVEQPAPIVVADAAPPETRRETVVAVASAIAAAKSATEPSPVESPAAPPVAPPVAVAAAPAPPPAPVMAAPAPAPPPAAVALAKPSPVERAEALTRADAAADNADLRERAAAQASHGRIATDAPASVTANAVMPANARLMAAVNRSDAAAVRAALQAGALVHLRDSQGRTVLMLAARAGSREVVDLLLAAGARKSDRDPQGWKAVDHARAEDHGDLAERLR